MLFITVFCLYVKAAQKWKEIINITIQLLAIGSPVDQCLCHTYECTLNLNTSAVSYKSSLKYFWYF